MVAPLVTWASFGAVPIPAALAAQTDAALVRADALRGIVIGSPIRVRTVGQSVYIGALIERSDSAIAIRDGRDVHRAEVGRVAAVWIRRPSTGRGALIGAGAGFVTFALAGALLGQGLCDAADCRGAALEGATGAAPIGALFGGVVGAGFGYFIRHWQQLWP